MPFVSVGVMGAAVQLAQTCSSRREHLEDVLEVPRAVVCCAVLEPSLTSS